MSTDRDVLWAHKEWISLLQPVGLVVSPPALQKAQVVASRNVTAEQQVLTGLTIPFEEADNGAIPELRDLLEGVLRWRASDLARAPEGLEVHLPAYQDVLRPTYVVPDPDGASQMLVEVLPRGADPDRANPQQEGWKASPQERFERLLRELGISAGLLWNGTTLRLVYAPKGETSGHMSFPIQGMTEVGGRSILSGLLCLLDADCVFSPDKPRRLTTLLSESRKYQATVSNALAGQVLEALHELLRGVQVADQAAGGRHLATVVPEHHDHLYAGLVSVLMRLVFLLYAEDRDLMPKDPVYAQHYSIGGLYERLRADHGLYPDTMDQRYGAWSHLLSLFRLVHDGGKHAGLSLPARNGELFNPDSYPFLEGRPYGVHRVLQQIFDAPKVPDGVIYRVLQNLLLLDEERLSYRSLDVEQIGSVYEAIMGFGVERALGPSIGLKPKHIVVNLESLLRKGGADRSRWIGEEAECKLPAGVAAAVGAAGTVEALVAALGSRVSPYTPVMLPRGALYLQPGQERRRSGSHYTPRELTAPIVKTTLRPIFEAMGERPTPEQILSLKVCDPAMGSGAFLVEACRQLGEKLVEAWDLHGRLPEIPPDEEPFLFARRKVAQSCLYGVDKNPMAASLAKLSLWLVTLARDHAFTFLDHALKHGDSLVGFSRLQIASFRWDVVGAWSAPLFSGMAKNLGKAKAERRRIQELGDDHDALVRDAFEAAEVATREARLKGDLLVAAFFGGGKPKEREALRSEYLGLWQGRVDGSLVAGERVSEIVADLRSGERAVPAFHWEIEFPEVFDRENEGFDCFVGNPPFLGGLKVSEHLGMSYFGYISSFFAPAGYTCDLSAYFVRQMFRLLRMNGSLGTLATKTIAQGETRVGGLEVIRRDGGTIYAATRRIPWPGAAAVIAASVHIHNGRNLPIQRRLDDRSVGQITAYLFPLGPDAAPQHVGANPYYSAGCNIAGQGFVFDDADPKANKLSAIAELVEANPKNADRIFPYLGGSELNKGPTQAPTRFVLNLSDIREEGDLVDWPELAQLARRTVKPERDALGSNPNNIALKRRWWAYHAHRPELQDRLTAMQRVLVIARVSQSFAFTFVSARQILSEKVVVIATEASAALASLQCRVHEVWTRFLCATLKDDLQYTASDCFETFPFPPDWQSDPALEEAGQVYYEFRAALMVRNNEGLTKTYNRFHDRQEQDPDILRLRELHAEMDRAVLHAYGWDDIPTACGFYLDYEIDEETWGDKKKPYRYRWPDEVRDDVLARLLEMNGKRAEEERLAALTGNAAPAGKKAGAGGKGKAAGKATTKATEPIAAPALFAPRKEG